MGGVAEARFEPVKASALIYDELYKLYNDLYENFGSNGAMHNLRIIRDKALIQMEGNK
jgi:L-ribulokinase